MLDYPHGPRGIVYYDHWDSEWDKVGQLSH
jgi:hypothetical protein